MLIDFDVNLELFIPGHINNYYGYAGGEAGFECMSVSYFLAMHMCIVCSYFSCNMITNCTGTRRHWDPLLKGGDKQGCRQLGLASRTNLKFGS